MMDDRTLRAYLRNNSAWNLDESAPGPPPPLPPMDHFNGASFGNGDKLLNSSVHFPAEMRSANLNEMVSSIIDENPEYHPNGMMPTFSPYPSMMMPTTWSNGEQPDQHTHYMQQAKHIPPRQPKFATATISESGYPRNIPDLCSIRANPPKDLQVLVRKGDHTGISSLITNMSLQQFRQMIGLQSSASLTISDRRISSSVRPSDNRRPYSSINNNPTQPLSSSSSSSSSSIPSLNPRLANAFKQRSQDTILQQNYPSFPNNDRQQHSPMQPMSPHDTISMNFTGANGTSTINDTNLTSSAATYQDISYFRSNRRTGVANTLHIAIEKCYEQLNYIRDSYTETESKIGIQTLHKSASTSLINDIANSNFSTLSNNPSRVDRLIAEYHYEYTRILRLHERVKETVNMHDTEATRQTLDEWLITINNVQDRRRQEIDNAAEKCRSGEPRLPDEKDVLQLADALRILRITTRKIRTVLWYWLYWSTNSTTNKIPLIARHHDEQLNTAEFHSMNQNDQHSNFYLFYPSTKSDDESKATLESDEQQRKFLLKNSISSNDNNKENECNK
ncbi:unnamed protein product [Rotaria magnacalcarata]